MENLLITEETRKKFVAAACRYHIVAFIAPEETDIATLNFAFGKSRISTLPSYDLKHFLDLVNVATSLLEEARRKPIVVFLTYDHFEYLDKAVPEFKYLCAQFWFRSSPLEQVRVWENVHSNDKIGPWKHSHEMLNHIFKTIISTTYRKLTLNDGLESSYDTLDLSELNISVDAQYSIPNTGGIAMLMTLDIRDRLMKKWIPKKLTFDPFEQWKE